MRAGGENVYSRHVFVLWTIVAFAVVAAPSAGAEEDFCESHLLPTSEVISYLEVLQEHGRLGIERLTLLRHQIAQHESLNPWALDPASTPAQIHSRNFARLVARTDVNLSVLQEWTEDAMNQQSGAERQRRATRADTKSMYPVMTFVRIPGGTYIDETGAVIAVADFEVTETLVTQAQWIAVEKENPSYYQSNSDGIAMRPTNPVEGMTLQAAMSFANHMSELIGLRSVYTEALAVEAPHKGSTYTLITSETDPIQETEGYRLLTLQEWHYLLSRADAGRIVNTELKKYAWVGPTIGHQTEPVGTTGAHFTVDGTVLYDLLGNVTSWLHPQRGQEITTTGIGHLSDAREYYCAEKVQYCKETCLSLKNGCSDTGLRLARTVPREGARP